MPLPSFTVTGDLFNILGVAASELATPRLTGTATFTSNVPSDEFVTWQGAGGSVGATITVYLSGCEPISSVPGPIAGARLARLIFGR